MILTAIWFAALFYVIWYYGWGKKKLNQPKYIHHWFWCPACAVWDIKPHIPAPHTRVAQPGPG